MLPNSKAEPLQWSGKPKSRHSSLLLARLDCSQPQQSRIACCRAPEPTDVWWENLSVRGREAWQLRLRSAAITIAIVAAGGVVQFYLAQAGEDERLRRLTYEVRCR